ncbi:hypothetical protein ACWERJ_24845, partial [Streptomyces sp. NPDC004050]
MPAASSPDPRPTGSPASFLAAAAALSAIERELGDAHGPAGNAPNDPREALAALLLLREVRDPGRPGPWPRPAASRRRWRP